jgi:hypothetical protein
MGQQLGERLRLHLTTIRIGIFFWMVLVIFVYLLLFGPPEFWSISTRLGFRSFFEACRDLLRPFFTAAHWE